METDIFGKGQREEYNEENRQERIIPSLDNRKFDDHYDIKIRMGPQYFAEFMKFMKDINYDMLIIFQKDKIMFYSIGNEIVDKTNNEIRCLIGLEFVDKITLSEQYPVDMYIDLKNNKMSIINGKEMSWRRLISLKNDNIVLSSNKGVEERLNEWTNINSPKRLSKIVVGTTLRGVLQSLDKKRTDKKSKKTVEVKFSKKEIDFTLSDQIGGTSVQMYGEDIVDSNLEKNMSAIFNVEYLAKFGKFKQFFNNINLYVKTDHPLVMETTMGSGGITIQYFIAPHVILKEDEEESNVNTTVNTTTEETSPEETKPEENSYVSQAELEENDLQEV